MFAYGIPGTKAGTPAKARIPSTASKASNSIIATSATLRTPLTTQTTAKATLRTLAKKEKPTTAWREVKYSRNVKL